MRPTVRLAGAGLLGAIMVTAAMDGLRRSLQATEPVARRASAASSREVAINEIAWGGTLASSFDEWVELRNNTPSAVDVTGWTLISTDGSPRLTLDGTIPASGYFLLERTNDDTVSTIPADQIYTGSLGNSGEGLELRDASNSLVDSANAAGGEWPAGSGSPDHRTMERANPAIADQAAHWCSNDGTTTNGQDADGNSLNGTPKARNSCQEPPSTVTPDLVISKSGPSTAAAGDIITYQISISNTSAVTATATRASDALPTSVRFISQSSAFSFSRQANLIEWSLEDVVPFSHHLVTVSVEINHSVSGSLTNTVAVTTTAAETTFANNTDSWRTLVTDSRNAQVLITAVLYDGYQYGDSDEAVELVNLGTVDADLTNWRLCDDATEGACAVLPVATLAAGDRLWLARKAVSFTTSFGFPPGFEAIDTSPDIADLGGTWPQYANSGDEVVLRDAGGGLVDTLVYEDGLTTTVGWSGLAVQPYLLGGAEGQTLYRKLDQVTGLPTIDTDCATDWAQDPNDPINGRKLRYPGWDLEEFFFPTVATPTIPITIAVAPDGVLNLVSRTLASARHSILVQAYTFESVALYQVISESLRAGVAVTMFLEGHPAFQAQEDATMQLWITEHIDAHRNGSVYYLHGDHTRYRYQHAKFIIVDGQAALVSTENFNPRGMPADLKGNGTQGHRGFAAAMRSRDIVKRLQTIFARDLDPAHHADVVPHGAAPFSFDDSTFAPIPEPDWTTYPAPFIDSLVTQASDLTVIQAPENALRDQDGLLGLWANAGSGDAIAAIQMSEPFTWTPGVGQTGQNPRIQSLLRAARRGAEVRVLLDAAYDSDGDNAETCHLLNLVATQERLNVACRLSNVTGLGIHAKAFFVSVGGEHWVHLGSINGTRYASKRSREVAIQFRSAEAYGHMMAVFDHDWGESHSPMFHHVLLPAVSRGSVPSAAYPLISEVFVNPGGDDAGGEWIEIYNPSSGVSITGWMLGDAASVGDYGDGRYGFPSDAVLLHGQVIVVAACASTFSTAYGFNPTYEWMDCSPEVRNLVAADRWDGFGIALGNTLDEAFLLRADGTLVDGAAWGGEPRDGMTPFNDYVAPFPTGSSLKRFPVDTDRDDCQQDFYVSYNPSPGFVSGG